MAGAFIARFALSVTGVLLRGFALWFDGAGGCVDRSVDGGGDADVQPRVERQVPRLNHLVPHRVETFLLVVVLPRLQTQTPVTEKITSAYWN